MIRGEFSEIIVDLNHTGDVVLHRHVLWFLQKASHPVVLILEGFLEKKSKGYCLNAHLVARYGFVAVDRCDVFEVGQKSRLASAYVFHQW